MLLIALVALSSCRNTIDFQGSNIELSFSKDTIYLDTVFTGLGSSTRILKVYNTSSENMTVDKIRLARGAGSYYRMNVDYLVIGQGIAGTWLSYFLLKQGKSVLVIDQWDEHSASHVASGIINPITGRNFVKT